MHAYYVVYVAPIYIHIYIYISIYLSIHIYIYIYIHALLVGLSLQGTRSKPMRGVDVEPRLGINFFATMRLTDRYPEAWEEDVGYYLSLLLEPRDTHTYMYIYIYTCICMCIYIYICRHTSLKIHTCIHTYRHVAYKLRLAFEYVAI